MLAGYPGPALVVVMHTTNDSPTLDDMATKKKPKSALFQTYWRDEAVLAQFKEHAELVAEAVEEEMGYPVAPKSPGSWFVQYLYRYWLRNEGQEYTEDE